MKFNKFAYSKPLRNHTLKIMEKYLEIYFKNLEISWNFVSPKKWEPCQLFNDNLHENIINVESKVRIPDLRICSFT